MSVSLEDFLDLFNKTLTNAPGPLKATIEALQKNPEMTDIQIRAMLREDK